MTCEKCTAEVEDKIMRALRAMLDEAKQEDEENPQEDPDLSATAHAQSHGFHYYLLLDWLTKDKKPYFVDPVPDITGPLFSTLPPAAGSIGENDAVVAARKEESKGNSND